MSTHTGIVHTLVEVVDHGRITSERWPGKVSADETVHVLELDPGSIDQAVKRLNEFFCPRRWAGSNQMY